MIEITFQNETLRFSNKHNATAFLFDLLLGTNKDEAMQEWASSGNSIVFNCIEDFTKSKIPGGQGVVIWVITDNGIRQCRGEKMAKQTQEMLKLLKGENLSLAFNQWTKADKLPESKKVLINKLDRPSVIASISKM